MAAVVKAMKPAAMKVAMKKAMKKAMQNAMKKAMQNAMKKAMKMAKKSEFGRYGCWPSWTMVSTRTSSDEGWQYFRHIFIKKYKKTVTIMAKSSGQWWTWGSKGWKLSAYKL